MLHDFQCIADLYSFNNKKGMAISAPAFKPLLSLVLTIGGYKCLNELFTLLFWGKI
jgi:hypothetical protein